MDWIVSLIVLLIPGALILLIIGLRVIDQYEVGLVLTLGKYTGTRKPGLNWILLGVQRMIKVDLRIATFDIPRQEVITKDNVTINIDAVVYFKVVNPEKAILDIQNYASSTILYAQAAMRDVVGNADLDTLLSQRDQISSQIEKIVDVETDKWGIDIQSVNIQNVELPSDMKRTIAKQAEAEREKRAVITKAEGELQASNNLQKAAEVLSSSPGALHLRTLSTLNDLSSDQSNTVVFAVPLEILRAFEAISDNKGKL